METISITRQIVVADPEHWRHKSFFNEMDDLDKPSLCLFLGGGLKTFL